MVTKQLRNQGELFDYIRKMKKILLAATSFVTVQPHSMK